MKKLIKIIDGLSLFGGWLAGLMIVAALILVVGEVIWRTALSSTLYISDEYSGYLMAMVSFCGLAYTLREKGHIRMMMFPSLIKGKWHIILNMFCFAIGFVFCLAFTWFTFEFFWDSYVNESRSMHVSETYLAIPQFFMPFGAALMSLQFISEFLKGISILRGDTDGLNILEEKDDLGR